MVLSTAACAGTASESTTAPDGTYRVIATTSVFADLAKMALGDSAQIESIVPAGIDVHTFQPSPSDVEKIQSADLIIANGLSLDGWIGSLIERHISYTLFTIAVVVDYGDPSLQVHNGAGRSRPSR